VLEKSSRSHRPHTHHKPGPRDRLRPGGQPRRIWEFRGFAAEQVLPVQCQFDSSARGREARLVSATRARRWG